MSSKKKIRSIRLEDEIWNHVLAAAEREDRTASAIVRLVLKDAFNAGGKNHDK